MHIAAVMSILEMSDLDRNAKHAVLVVACRADRYTAMAEISIPRVASDMGVGYHAATNGLNRAVEAGYLAVDKSRGRAPIWRLTTAVLPNNHRDSGGQPPRSRPRTKEVRILKECAVAAHPGDGAGENPPAAAADYPSHAARLRLIRSEIGR